jgi:hypothetical protein
VNIHPIVEPPPQWGFSVRREEAEYNGAVQETNPPIAEKRNLVQIKDNFFSIFDDSLLVLF